MAYLYAVRCRPCYASLQRFTLIAPLSSFGDARAPRVVPLQSRVNSIRAPIEINFLFYFPPPPPLARFRGDSRLSLEFSFASQLIAAKNRGGSASISGRPNFAIPVCIRVRLRTRWLVVHTRLRFNARLLSNLLFFLAPPSLSYSSLDSIRPSLATDFPSISRIENDNFPRRIFPSLLPSFRYTRCAPLIRSVFCIYRAS